ncbi:MAG: ATP-binding protein [Acidimicrobiales bacterium]
MQSAPDLELRVLDATSPGMVRRALRDLLGPAAAEPIGHAAQLVCSELVNNVLVHTDGGGWLTVWWIPHGLLRLEVEDTDVRMPELPTVPSPAQLHGRGLHIVDTVASRWGMFRSSRGKTVWCELDAIDA